MSPPPPTVEQIQCLLQRCGSSGYSVYDHLTDLVAALIAEQPEDPYAAFESISQSLKVLREKKNKTKSSSIEGAPQGGPPGGPTGGSLGGPSRGGPLGGAPCTLNAEKALEHWSKSMKHLLQQIAAPGKELSFSVDCTDFFDENRLMCWAGCGFNDKEAFKIYCCLKQLAASIPGVSSVRYWGKILAKDEDYIIAETRFEGEEPEGETATEEETAMDKRGTGVNTYTYFALQGDSNKWRLLPDALPSHLETARKIKKILSGDLNKQVVTFPWFAGRERHLLRALIALISSETILCPSGWLQAMEEGSGSDPQGDDPEFEFPTNAQTLASVGSWCHYRPYITKSGLTVYPEVDEEDEEAKQLQETIEEEPILELGRSITEDSPLPNGSPAWCIRTSGDTSTYKETYNNAVVSVHSCLWPGAVTIYHKKTFFSIYNGWGLLAGAPPFFPFTPNDVQADLVDLNEQLEPQPGDEELSDGASHDEEETEKQKDDEDEEEEETEEETQEQQQDEDEAA
ncbi:radial spokehead-L protein, putative [Eimeria acervulina]|uniref:Radial spokehead-L protein, putative n=1 Tax=Eimeria acervulina TaxID=5801 RepID=U6GAR3_EIMAC|nr:radial spokehead-L protein, putative [Eimeria acervulina]CDI76428.1 radial spokehead-L protein, putative [Eimeria acervulina]